MVKSITKVEGKAFRKRWKAVKATELKELRSTPIPQKFRQLAVLMLSAKQFDWTKVSKEEDAEVRDRWNRLRKAFHG